MYQIIPKEKLNLLKPYDSMGKALENYYLMKDAFCEKRYEQLIVDDDGILIGGLEKPNRSDYDISAPVSSYMDTNFFSLNERENENQYIVCENSNKYLVPVVNAKGQLLYAFERCASIVEHWYVSSRERESFEHLLASAFQYKHNNNDKTVFICSNKGKCSKSVTIEDIGNLEKNSVVFIGYDEDYIAEDIVRRCMEAGIEYRNECISSTNVFRFDINAKRCLDELALDNSPYFDWEDFQVIFQCIKNTKSLDGKYVEIGVFRGDSAKAAMKYMQLENINRQCFFLDTYEGFSYDDAYVSQDGLWAGSHTDTSINLVKYRLKEFDNVNCMAKNIITDILPEEIDKIAMANIDVDIYEATVAAMEKVHERLQIMGIMLVEDFGHTPALIGAMYAVDEFLRKHQNEYLKFYARGSQVILIKK